MSLSLKLDVGLSQRSSRSGAFDGFAPASVYSTRLAKSSYTGAALRVRRSSDSAQQDIGFSGGALDTSALLAFVGAGSGAIVTWYDQAGSVNVTNATTSAQPLIVNSGSLITLGGSATVSFNGTAHHLFNAADFGLYGAGSMTAFAGLSGAGQNSKLFISEGSSSTTTPIYGVNTVAAVSSEDLGAYVRNDANTVLVAPATVLATGGFDGAAHVVTVKDTGSAMTGYVDGTAGTSAAYTRSGGLTVDRFCIGALLRSTAALHFAGSISEVVLFKSAVSDGDRGSLETIISGYIGA